MSNFNLKAIKFYENLSQETNCFTANIYYNNSIIGMAENDGKGCSTNVYLTTLDKAISNKQYSAIRDAAIEVKTLLELKPDDYKYQSVIESIVDDLFEKWLKDDYELKLNKIINKKSVNHLIFEDLSSGDISSIKYTPSIEVWISKNPERIKEVITNQIATGAKLLNNNIEENFYL